MFTPSQVIVYLDVFLLEMHACLRKFLCIQVNEGSVDRMCQCAGRVDEKLL